MDGLGTQENEPTVRSFIDIREEKDECFVNISVVCAAILG